MKGLEAFLWWTVVCFMLDAVPGRSSDGQGYAGFQPSSGQYPPEQSSGYGINWLDNWEEFWSGDDDYNPPSYPYDDYYRPAKGFSEVVTNIDVYPQAEPGGVVEWQGEESVVEPYGGLGEDSEEAEVKRPPESPVQSSSIASTLEAPKSQDVPNSPQPSEPVAISAPVSNFAKRRTPAPQQDSPGLGRTCIYVCLINVACSGQSAKCRDRVFISGSFWCRFFSECPRYDPAYTVIYIPYKPVGAPSASAQAFHVQGETPVPVKYLAPAPKPDDDEEGDSQDDTTGFASFLQPASAPFTKMLTPRGDQPQPVPTQFLGPLLPISDPVTMVTPTSSQPASGPTNIARPSSFSAAFMPVSSPGTVETSPSGQAQSAALPLPIPLMPVSGSGQLAASPSAQVAFTVPSSPLPLSTPEVPSASFMPGFIPDVVTTSRSDDGVATSSGNSLVTSALPIPSSPAPKPLASQEGTLSPVEIPTKKSSQMTFMPRASELPDDSDVSTMFPPPVVPECFYVCKDNLCDASSCGFIKPGVCAFWSLCPPDLPYSHIVELPREAETDPPGTWIPTDNVQSTLNSGH